MDITRAIQAALPADAWFQENQNTLSLRDGLAWKGSKIYVPSTLWLDVLQCCHDARAARHFGFLKTLHLTNRQFWWPQIKKGIEDYVRSCVTCTTMKKQQGKPPGFLQPVASPVKPWEEVAMDFIVDLPESQGNTVVWTIIDLFSKQAHFVACPGLPSARKLAKLFITHIYHPHGVTWRIVSN